MRTHLAWRNLAADRRRLLLAAAGIGFAAILMFMQNGFRHALLDSHVAIIHAFNADLIAHSPARYALPSEQRFPRELLDLARADPDVTDVVPLYMETYRAQLRVAGRPRRAIRVIGVPTRPGHFENQDIERQVAALEGPGTALLDRRTRRHFGLRHDDVELLASQTIELLNKRMQFIGTFTLGSDFAHEGTLLTSADSFANYFAFRGGGEPLEIVDLALIQVSSPAKASQIAERLTALDTRQWRVVTKQQLIDHERAFWEEQTPVGKIFGIGAVMGFAVGVIICYQILFTSIHDSMAEYATLKAMGYPNGYFIRLVMFQSVYLALLGFIPALVVCLVLFRGLEQLTGLPMLLDVGRALTVLQLTLAMCLVSGIIVIRKLLRADPASLF